MKDRAPLTGKQVVVTGASRGIGLVIAHDLARQGARLNLVARDPVALEAVIHDLDGSGHTLHAFDVTNEAGWADLAAIIAEGPVDGLVTAAGVLGPIGPLGSWEVKDFRVTFEVNVIGTLLAVLALLPALGRAKGSVVTFSGGGATGAFPRFDAYATSKAAVVRLTENLARDLADRQIRVNAVAPGFIVTEMHDSTIAAGPEIVGEAYFERTRAAVEGGGGDDPQLAADLTTFLLSSAADGVSGKLISARWDPWRDADFLARLRSDDDFCTIRRIDGQFFDVAGR